MKKRKSKISTAKLSIYTKHKLDKYRKGANDSYDKIIKRLLRGAI
jgi:hypothetical protein